MRNMLKDKKIIILIVTVVLVALCGIFWWVSHRYDLKVPNTYDYDDLTEYITLGNYKGIEYTRKVEKVTDSDVRAKIDAALEDAATTEEVKSGTVGNKSTVKIDFTGKIDGKEFDGGSSEDYTLDIANDSMIDGFSEGIVGHKVGDEFDLNLTFPSDYSNSDVAGKDVVFTIKVNAIVKTVTPEYNDAFVKKNTDYKTTEEYEKAIRKELEEANEQEADENAYSAIYSKIVKASEVKKYPEAELESAENTMTSTYKSMAENYGMEFQDFLKQYLGMDEATFNKKVKAYAKNIVKQQLVSRQLAHELDVKISNKDYNEYIENLLESNGLTKSTFKEKMGSSLKDYAEQNNLYDGLLYTKVMEKVLTLSKAK